MGTDDHGEHVYDLRRIEDVFACLEIISIARGAMFGVNPELARRMEKVSDALGAFAQIVMEGGLVAAPAETFSGEMEKSPATQPGAMTTDVFADLTAGIASPGKPASAKSAFPAGGRERSGIPPDEGIVDILTGEKIK